MKYIVHFLFISVVSYAQDIKTITWEESSINGKLPLTLLRREFEAIYKKADSIVTPDYLTECGSYEDDTYQYFFYKGLKYELDNGVLNFRQLIFYPKSGLFFKYKDFRFDEKTTLKDFEKQYPKGETYDADLGKFKKLKVIVLPVIEDNNEEWRFYFNKGLLVAVECHLPCYG
jgi:hypothetical protein